MIRIVRLSQDVADALWRDDKIRNVDGVLYFGDNVIDVGDVTGKIDKSIGTTKGDIIVFTGSATPVRLPVGTDGQVLTADSAEAEGVKWETPSAASGGIDYPEVLFTQVFS